LIKFFSLFVSPFVIYSVCTVQCNCTYAFSYTVLGGTSTKCRHISFVFRELAFRAVARLYVRQIPGQLILNSVLRNDVWTVPTKCYNLISTVHSVHTSSCSRRQSLPFYHAYFSYLQFINKTFFSYTVARDIFLLNPPFNFLYVTHEKLLLCSTVSLNECNKCHSYLVKR
jgi:hypothetical protein